MKQQRAHHRPEGNPCAKCGLGAVRHVVEHPFTVECCSLPESCHRVRKPKPPSSPTPREPKEKTKRTHRTRPVTYVGIDGEGHGREDHRYVMLAASSENGRRLWCVERPEGLSTKTCLDFILRLPSDVRVFGYSLNYDWTMMLRDLDDESLYLLFRPDLRREVSRDGEVRPKAVKWRGYHLNLQGTKFSVRKGRKRRVVWDIFKFFQSKFVNALEDWKVGNKDLWDRMRHMKDQRAAFDKVYREDPDSIRRYCLEECRAMAELAHRLVDAHHAAGLELKAFYGAGSSASAMLKRMGVGEKIREVPEAMREAVSSAFFGGRFENSVIGRVRERVHSYDISSAYPYQLTKLPCLLHTVWEHTKSETVFHESKHALVDYALRPRKAIEHWGPFPFRTEDGSISFPRESGGGWIWRDEYLAGFAAFSEGIHFRGAWVGHQTCDCRPFAEIPHFYRERCRIGKEGPGIVLKLGCNSCYGKLAQSVGDAPFNSWAWAGMITSGCRAQVLDALSLHEDRSNLLMVATDGIYTREEISMPAPTDTGTEATGKPLGGWEHKVLERGVFCARPGIYFPLDPTPEELKVVRARGLGKSVLLDNWQRVVMGWERYGLSRTVSIARVVRFCGAKSSISRAGLPGLYSYKRADRSQSPVKYASWVERRVEMSFDPRPKREGVERDGKTLRLRAFPQAMRSTPYSRAQISRESLEFERMREEALEQPEGDVSMYEEEETVE